MPSVPRVSGLIEVSPVVRASPIMVTSQAVIAPALSVLAWAVASVKRNSYGPVVISVPGGTLRSRSVRRSKPPSPQTAAITSTSARPIPPYTSPLGTDRRGGSPTGAGHWGLTSPSSSQTPSGALVSVGGTGSV